MPRAGGFVKKDAKAFEVALTTMQLLRKGSIRRKIGSVLVSAVTRKNWLLRPYQDPGKEKRAEHLTLGRVSKKASRNGCNWATGKRFESTKEKEEWRDP